MKKIYVCPHCGRRYTVHESGSYICDCGSLFSYSDILSSTKHNYEPETPALADCTSTSVVRRHVSFHMPTSGASWLRSGSKEDCPYANASLILGFLGLFLFGLLSLPAILAGFFAKEMICDPHLSYRGYGKAVAGMLLGIIGLLWWGAFLFLRF